MMMSLATWTLPPESKYLVTTNAFIAIAICAILTLTASPWSPRRLRRFTLVVAPAFLIATAVFHPDSPVVLNRFFWHSEWVGFFCFLAFGTAFSWRLMRGRSITLYMYGTLTWAVGVLLLSYYFVVMASVAGFLPTRNALDHLDAQIAMLFLYIIVATATIYMTARQMLRRRQEYLRDIASSNGFCPACGYDLRGTSPGRTCPECGAAGQAVPHDMLPD